MGPIQRRALAIAPWLALSFGCGESGALLTQPMTLLPPAAAGRSVVFVDSHSHNATLLNVDDLEAEPIRVALPHAPQPLIARPGTTGETLTLCRGRSDDPRNESEEAALVVLSEAGEDRRYPLSARFNAIHVSDDGRYAMLFFDDDAASDSLIFNPNEIAIVDLTLPASADNPRTRTLRSFGSAPSHIVFSPQLQVADTNLRLAVVLFQTVVLLIDLDHLDRPEYTVELATGSERDIDLAQVVFDPERGRLYLRGDSSSDVYVLTLSPSTSADNDFVPSLNQLGIGGVPRDLALYESNGEARLLAITDSAQAVVVDTDTSRTTAIALPRNATDIQIYEAESPFDPVVEQRALLYSTHTSSVMFLDLRDVEERRARNLETLAVQAIYSNIRALDDNLVLLMHLGTGLSLLDLTERTASPIFSNQNLNNAVPDPDANKLWLAPPGQTQLGFLDLNDFHPGAIDLTRSIQSLVQIGGEGPRKLAVVHHSTVGHVTVLDSANPADLSLANATRGYLLTNVLDRAEEENP